MNSNVRSTLTSPLNKENIMKRLAMTACWLTLSVTVAGCGSSSGPSAQAVDASISASNGFAAIDEEVWEVAEAELTAAIDANVLSGDQYEEAMLGRVRARLRSDNLDAAEEDLALLEEGAAAMDQVLSLQAELQLKRGDAAAAKKTVQLARKINRNVVAPVGL